MSGQVSRKAVVSEEKILRVNVLELLAAKLAIMTFTMTQKDGISILL